MILNSTNFDIHSIRIKVVVFFVRIRVSVKVDRRLRDIGKTPLRSRSRCDLYLGGNGALEWVFIQRVQEALQFLALPPDDSSCHTVNRKSQDNGNPTIVSLRYYKKGMAELTKQYRTVVQYEEDPI